MSELQYINTLLQKRCTFVHDDCRVLANKFIDYHNNGNKIDNQLFTLYLNYLCNTHHYDKCIYRENIYVPVFKLIFCIYILAMCKCINK